MQAGFSLMEIFSAFIVLFAVIDIIGSMPVIIELMVWVFIVIRMAKTIERFLGKGGVYITPQILWSYSHSYRRSSVYPKYPTAFLATVRKQGDVS